MTLQGRRWRCATGHLVARTGHGNTSRPGWQQPGGSTSMKHRWKLLKGSFAARFWVRGITVVCALQCPAYLRGCPLLHAGRIQHQCTAWEVAREPVGSLMRGYMSVRLWRAVALFCNCRALLLASEGAWCYARNLAVDACNHAVRELGGADVPSAQEAGYTCQVGHGCHIFLRWTRLTWNQGCFACALYWHDLQSCE